MFDPRKYCVRCGLQGHSSHECKYPIMPHQPPKPPEEPPKDEQTEDYQWVGFP